MRRGGGAAGTGGRGAPGAAGGVSRGRRKQGRAVSAVQSPSTTRVVVPDSDPQQRIMTPSSIPSCPGCGTLVGADVKALQCDGCGREDAWKCIECLGISVEIYELLINGAGGELKWMCAGCESGMTTGSPGLAIGTCPEDRRDPRLDIVIAMLEKILDRHEHFERKLAEKCDLDIVKGLEAETKQLKCELTKVAGDIGGRMTDIEQRLGVLNSDSFVDIDRRMKSVEQRTEIQAIMAEVVNGNALRDKFDGEVVEATVEKAVNKKIEEDKDIDQRRCNIVVFGVAEDADPESRRQSDIKFVGDLYKEITDTSLNEDGITKLFRLGRRELNGKDRPLLVSFKDIDTKAAVMSNLTKLRGINKRLGSISITHDLSPRQREEVKKVLAEARTKYGGLKGTDGAENWKVIVVGQQSARPRAIRVRTN